MFKKINAFCVLIFCMACNFHKDNTNQPSQNMANVLFTNLDTTINPSNDFFEFANGGWLKKNAIPEDQSSWGIGQVVQEENNKRLLTICEKAANENAAEGTTSQKIGNFWKTAMDSTAVELDSLKSITPYLIKINNIKDVNTLMNTIAELRNMGVPLLFSGNVAQDDKNSEVMAYRLDQGGLGLRQRDYYFKSDSATINIRNSYIKYISQMLILIGEDSINSKKMASDILSLETKMATYSRKLEDLRDPYKNYNKTSINDLNKLSPEINWKDFLIHSKVSKIDSVIVGQPEFFKNFNSIINNSSLNIWKNYIKFNFINEFAEYLPAKFGVAAFNFKALFSGAKQRLPRWKRAMQVENSLLGELLGQLYVKDYFSETAKKRYEKMTEEIRLAFKTRISKLTWMSDSTKQKAYIKLAAISKKVGYPDKWKDFSEMKISTQSYLQNVINAQSWWYNFNINKLGKPVDRSEWDMTPQTYNAYYNPSNNEIVLPAAQMMVPGYKDEELDDALVYGYTAASTIGHEITHGFDDEGRQFDAKGNLVNWWTKQDEAAFNQHAQLIIKQFDEFEPIPGYHINGKATTGENIADLGGILLGFDAFKNTEQFKQHKKINGYTPEQLFFLGYSLGWLSQTREAKLRNQLLTDVHAPAKQRVNGPFTNIPEFYTAFNVNPNNKMYRADSLRVSIW